MNSLSFTLPSGMIHSDDPINKPRVRSLSNDYNNDHNQQQTLSKKKKILSLLTLSPKHQRSKSRSKSPSPIHRMGSLAHLMIDHIDKAGRLLGSNIYINTYKLSKLTQGSLMNNVTLMAVRLGDPVEKSHGRDDINDRYHRYDKVLGRGAYKTVYWGFDTSEGVDVAWNCIDLDALPSTEERSKILREVFMLQQLKHKHILRIRNHWENPISNQLCFITDIVQGGSLRQYIRERSVNLLRVKSWCCQILDALHYLHSSNPVIIHRDLKCDNIFIDGPSGNITIGDLGLSTKYMDVGIDQKGMSIVGTPEFMAPELYEEVYDEKVDIYAFGMCLLEMISKKYPYEECSNQIQVIRKVTDKKQPDILRKIHRNVRTFIELCIEQNPSKRPSANELLQHPFLCNLDDLTNKRPSSDFVYLTDEKQRIYQKILSTIPESINLKKQKQQKMNNKTHTTTHNTMTTTTTTMTAKKKKYVSGTTVCYQECGKISVKLKIHHDKESQKVKFEYDPNTENIESVVREMVETLELDRSRENEIMSAINSKLCHLEQQQQQQQIVSNPNSMPTSPRNVKPHLHTQQSQNSIHTQPKLISNKTERQTYSEPNTAKEPNTNNQNPFYSEPETTPNQNTFEHFPKVFNPNGTTASIRIQSISNAAKSLSHQTSRVGTMPQSAPVTPGHSPQCEKNGKMNQSGYHSETETNVETTMQSSSAPQLVSNSLLDQIMALPRETIKGRIIQFGGTFHDDDATGILVTKLFQLLSSTNNGNGSQKNSKEQIVVSAAMDSSPSLVMSHNMKQNGLQNLNNSQMQNKSNGHSVQATPPNNNINIQRPKIKQKLTSISPKHELLSSYPPVPIQQISVSAANNSNKKGANNVNHIAHNRNNSNPLPSIMDEIDEEEDENGMGGDNELDPNIELPKLRIRQKELMKDKIRFEVERLKQRTDNRLGRDMTVDDIASELAQVEKQIKVLTDASKSGTKKIKIKQKLVKTESYPSFEKKLQRESSFPKLDLSQRNSLEQNTQILTSTATLPTTELSAYHSRNNSNESNQNQQQNNENVNVSKSNSASQSASFLISENVSLHRDEFDIHLKCLPNRLDLSDIRGIDFLFNASSKNVSFGVLTNAKERVKREKKQLEEEYLQYFADQTEMLILKLSKYRSNQTKRSSETASTQNKLRQKLDKQRNKFQSIVNDQLQILQLTQELNDESPQQIVAAKNDNLNLSDEYYLYKEQMDKNYILRVQEFEQKQKKEFDAFRIDLRALNDLKLEIKKKNVSASRSNTSSPNRSPNKQKQHKHSKSDHSNMASFTLSKQPIVDMLTGDNNNNEREHRQPKHVHSSSLPSLQMPQQQQLQQQQPQRHPHSAQPHVQSMHHQKIINQDVDKMTNQINTSLNDLNNIKNK